LVLGFGCFPCICNSLFEAVIGALSNLVSVLIDLDVGALRLEFLHTLESSLMDDWEVMIE